MLLQYYGTMSRGKLWTPASAQSDVILWHDAGDDSTVTIGGNGGYAQIDDKSNNAIPIENAFLSEQAARSGQLNGMYYAAFDGVNDRLYNGIGADISYSDSCFMILMRPGTVTLNTQAVLSMSGSGNDWQIQSQSSTQWIPRLEANTGDLTFSTVEETGWQLLCVDCDLSGAAELNAYFNGSLVDTYSSFPGWDETSLFYRWAVNRGNSNFLNCDIAETLFMQRTHRQKAEGYMLWKWGLESLLPAGHPYKNAAPKE